MTDTDCEGLDETSTQRRIAKWESFFSKYQNEAIIKESPFEFEWCENSWISSQNINNEGPPEGLKDLIDNIWQEEGNKTLKASHGYPNITKLIKGNNFYLGKNCFTKDDDFSDLDTDTTETTDDEFDEHDENDDDYLSDSDVIDTKPPSVNKTEFFTMFQEVCLSRTKRFEQRKEKLAGIFDTLLKERLPRETSIETAAVSPPTKPVLTSSLKKFSSGKHSPQGSKRNRLGKILSTSAASTTSQPDNRMTSKSPCGNSRTIQPEVILHRLKPSLSEHLNRLEIDSLSKPRKGDYHYTSRKFELAEPSSALKKSSFNEYLNKWEIDSLSKSKKEQSPKSPLKKSRVGVFSVYPDVPKDRKANGIISLLSTQPWIHGMSNTTSKQSKTTTRPSSIHGKGTVLDSSYLRRKLSGEVASIRSLKQGRSFFEI